MKIILAATLIIAIQGTVARADDKDSPPVPIRQPEPDWGPELSQSYLINPAKVTMVIDDRGIPFSLSTNGALPDNVVVALSEWRYRPGKKAGSNVPFSLSLVVPVRAILDASSERSLRRRSYSISKTIDEALHSGTGLDIGGAEILERNLTTDLNNIDIRAQLLLYSIESASTNAKEASERRARHIEFLVQNLPSERILASPLTVINVAAGPLKAPDAYGRIRDLWLTQLAAHPDDPTILEHATYFLRVSDSEKTEQLLLPQIRTLPEASIWLGDLYGLAILGVNALDLKTGLAVSAAPALPVNPFAEKARADLLATNNLRVLISALNTFIDHGRALSPNDSLPAGYAALCGQLLSRTKELDPGTAISCDLSAAVPESPQPISRIRVGGNIQQAHLVKKVSPAYPLDAKAKGIQGVVRFLTIIDKDGAIKNLNFVSGPLALYKSARDAVQQWVYKPTTLNGNPVEVVTTIEVNYTLSR